MTKDRWLSGILTGTLVLSLGVWWKAPAQERGERRAQVIQNGRLVGVEFPADWKLSQRAKNLTYTNPFNQNLAARWVDGEIVYVVSRNNRFERRLPRAGPSDEPPALA
jgi:hypothetical protein